MQMISKMMTTFSISQSAKKMRGDLPPSSRETFLRFESAQDLEGYTMMMMLMIVKVIVMMVKVMMMTTQPHVVMMMLMIAKMMTQPHDSVANLS